MTWPGAARRWLLGLLLAGLCTAASAQGQAPQDKTAQDQAADDEVDAASAQPLAPDPWEPFNRGVFKFNQDLDAGLLYPWASAYVALVPELVRVGINNFFNNADDLWSAINNLLQGKFENATVMTMRFAWNSTFGLAGVIDMATAFGMPRTPEDLGQTLGVWGVGTGNFLMLPFFGPSTVRDAVALPFDIAATPAYAINQGSFRPVTTVVQIIDTRAQFLDASNLMATIALDPYSFVRDAYLTRRFSQVYDGNPPYMPSPAVPAKDPTN